MRAATAALLLAVAGCGGDGGAAPLDLDIVIEKRLTEQLLVVYPREPGRECPYDRPWPAIGTCLEGTPDPFGTCPPPPVECLERVLIDVNGALFAGVLQPWGGWVFDGRPDLDGAHLLLDGCGGSTRIRLTVGNPGLPSVREVATTSDELRVRWLGPASTTAVLLTRTATDTSLAPETFCLDGTDGEITVPRPHPSIRQVDLDLAGLTGGKQVETSNAVARIWTLARHEVPFDVHLPTLQEDGRWLLPDLGISGMATTTVDGFSYQGISELLQATVLADAEPLDASLEFSGGHSALEGDGPHFFHYGAGQPNDVFRWWTNSAIVYAGEVPHVTPIEGLELGVAASVYRLALPEMVLTNDADPSDQHTVAFEISVGFPLIARPEE